MYEFIQALPNNPYFILVLLGIFGLVWYGMPKTKWWSKHICADFAESGHHPACFMCNAGNESCYTDWHKCEALRVQYQEHVLKVAKENN